MGQPSQNGPLTVQHFRSLLLDIMKAPFVVPTSIVTPSWFIAVALRLLDHALSYMSCTRATAALCSCAPAEKSRPPPTSLCADGSALARAFFRFAALVGAGAPALDRCVKIKARSPAGSDRSRSKEPVKRNPGSTAPPALLRSMATTPRFTELPSFVHSKPPP